MKLIDKIKDRLAAKGLLSGFEYLQSVIDDFANYGKVWQSGDSNDDRGWQMCRDQTIGRIYDKMVNIINNHLPKTIFIVRQSYNHPVCKLIIAGSCSRCKQYERYSNASGLPYVITGDYYVKCAYPDSISWWRVENIDHCYTTMQSAWAAIRHTSIPIAPIRVKDNIKLAKQVA